MRIGILSDTHGYLDPTLHDFFKGAEEIWHAGDWGGGLSVYTALKQRYPIVRGVFGNIDDNKLRKELPELNIFNTGGMRIMMIHICGNPGHYSGGIPRLIKENNPDIIIGGHSHILRVVQDKVHKAIFINPGAAGKYGIHTVRTAIRLTIENGKIISPEVIEMQPR